MNLRSFCLLLLISLSLAFGCSCNRAKQENPVDTTGLLPVLAQQNNDFAFQLFARVDEPGENLFFSPYSISSALSMVYGGAKGNTASEIASALSFSLPVPEQHAAFQALQQELNAVKKRKKAELNVANALFGAKRNQARLHKDYLELLRDSYASELYSLDFSDAKAAAGFINRWVEDKTNDRIKDLVSENHIRRSNDGLVLVNAIFFKGNWLNKFDPAYTAPDDFFTSSERSPETAKPVQMMTIQDDFRYARLPGCQLLELPYAEENLAMLFILPDDLDAFTTQLNTDSYAQWLAALNTQEVEVYIPKFTFDHTLQELVEKFKALGMKDAFDPGRADFSGIMPISPSERLFISDILHKAFVEVNETGTEAAAATAVVMEITSAAPFEEPPLPVFRADHPFLYLIIHKPSTTILFLGKFADPPMLDL